MSVILNDEIKNWLLKEINTNCSQYDFLLSLLAILENKNTLDNTDKTRYIVLGWYVKQYFGESIIRNYDPFNSEAKDWIINLINDKWESCNSQQRQKLFLELLSLLMGLKEIKEKQLEETNNEEFKLLVMGWYTDILNNQSLNI